VVITTCARRGDAAVASQRTMTGSRARWSRVVGDREAQTPGSTSKLYQCRDSSLRDGLPASICRGGHWRQTIPNGNPRPIDEVRDTGLATLGETVKYSAPLRSQVFSQVKSEAAVRGDSRFGFGRPWTRISGEATGKLVARSRG